MEYSKLWLLAALVISDILAIPDILEATPVWAEVQRFYSTVLADTPRCVRFRGCPAWLVSWPRWRLSPRRSRRVQRMGNDGDVGPPAYSRSGDDGLMLNT